MLGFALLAARLFWLTTDPVLAHEASEQSTKTVRIASERPDFCDRFGRKLTGASEQTYAMVLPSEPGSYAVLGCVPTQYREEFTEKMQSAQPFAIRVNEDYGMVPAKTFSLFERYSDDGLCAHLIGTLDANGEGASGLEAALNEYLSAGNSGLYISELVNANGRLCAGTTPTLYTDGAKAQDVTLTIDADIQRIAAECAEKRIKRGCAVVMDTDTAQLLALVSLPDFCQNDVAAALEENDGALVNKALEAYNVGSIYKPVIAAAALESGTSLPIFECTGVYETDGSIYNCNDSTAHGTTDLAHALTVSCNTYFVALAQRTGAQNVYAMAKLLGFGTRLDLFCAYGSGGGNMPTLAELSHSYELCNNSFGQGKLLASPLQVAAYTNAIASGGVWRDPSVLLSLGSQQTPQAQALRVMRKETANTLRDYLTQAVESGTGQNAALEFAQVAGKTGTAQTGGFDESGAQRTICWFTGFFPADNPKYTITIMTLDGGYGYENAAPVFADIANALHAEGFA